MSANTSEFRIMPATELPPLAVSIDDAAKLIGTSNRWLADYVASGELPSSKVGGRRIIRVAALEDFLRQRESGGKAADGPLSGP